jgi:DNA-binding transcriptional LysR family regulator
LISAIAGAIHELGGPQEITYDNAPHCEVSMPLHASVLKYFDMVVRLGSIRKAADRLNVASSAINRQIIKLEKHLGTPVFERLPRGMRLTPAGEVLISHVRNTLRDFNSVLAEIEDLKGLRKGLVAIAAVEGVAADFLPKIISDFHKEYPGISFTITILESDKVLSILQSNGADIGLMFNPPGRSGVKLEASISLKIGAIMSPSHPLGKRKAIRLAECRGYPLILPDITHPNRYWLNSILNDPNREVHPTASSNSFQLMRALAKYDLGIAFQTTVGIEEEIRTKKLVYVPLSDRTLKPSVLTVLSRAKYGLSGPASTFLKTLQKKVSSSTWSTESSRS